MKNVDHLHTGWSCRHAWACPPASGCTNPNSILNGTYGWQGEALFATPNSQARKIGDYVPLVQTGDISFDGDGNFSGAHDSSLGGALIPHVDSGTYPVNSDCTTGTVSFTTGVGFTMSFVRPALSVAIHMAIRPMASLLQAKEMASHGSEVSCLSRTQVRFRSRLAEVFRESTTRTLAVWANYCGYV
jgi:hypothetical protein